MPWLTSCCCGFSVKTGTKAIAILSLVYSVLGLLMVGTFKIERDRILSEKHRNWAASYNYMDHSIHKEMEVGLPTLRPRPNIFPTDLPDLEEQGDSKDDKERGKARRLELIMTVYAISVSVNFLVSLSLLAGVRLEQRWLLVPWISWNVLSLLVSQMAVFYAPNKAMSTIPDLFSTVISVYCILCVVSYFQELSASPPTNRWSRYWGLSNRGLSEQEQPDLEGRSGQDTTTHLSPRRPHLVVALPPAQDMGPPPAYPCLRADSPPVYDPPPPYPGSPDGSKVKEEVSEILGENQPPEQTRRKSVE